MAHMSYSSSHHVEGNTGIWCQTLTEGHMFVWRFSLSSTCSSSFGDMMWRTYGARILITLNTFITNTCFSDLPVAECITICPHPTLTCILLFQSNPVRRGPQIVGQKVLLQDTDCCNECLRTFSFSLSPMLMSFFEPIILLLGFLQQLCKMTLCFYICHSLVHQSKDNDSSKT